METSFIHIATLSVNHRYFKAGVFKTTEFAVAADSMVIMRELGLVVKPFPGGVQLFSSHPDALDNASSGIPLRIYIYCKDPYYSNYTDLPEYSPADNILYFNNMNLPSDVVDGTISLHEDGFVGRREVLAIRHGIWGIPAFAPNKTYVLTDVFDEQVWGDATGDLSQNYVRIDLSNLPEGILQLRADNELEEKIYHQPRAIWKKPFGIIELFAGVLYDYYQAFGTLDYQLHFKNRYTIWKYFLADPVYKQFKNLRITNSQNDPIFNLLGEQEVGGRNAIIFQSMRPMPLLEHSGEQLKLINEDTPITEVIKSLPWASPEQLFRNADQEESEPLYSHIYI